MKTILSLITLAMFIVGPMWAQEGPPPPAPPDESGGVPAGPPEPPPDVQGPPGARHFGPPPMHRDGLGAWWKNSEIVSQLQLSDDQVKNIEQAFLEHRLKLVDLRADLEKQELQLGPLLDADRPDEQKVAAQIDRVTSARGRLEKENAMMMLAIRRVLTVDQWKKLQTFRREHGPGPGGERQRFRTERGFRPQS